MHPVPASAVRRKARELLGRDSETLDERFFLRILRDAHDADVIDLRKRGDDYEVAPAAAVASVADQLAAAAPAGGGAESVRAQRGECGLAAARDARSRPRRRDAARAAEPRRHRLDGAARRVEPVSSGPALVLDAEPESGAAQVEGRTGEARSRTGRENGSCEEDRAAASAEKAAPKAKRPRAKKTATEA